MKIVRVPELETIPLYQLFSDGSDFVSVFAVNEDGNTPEHHAQKIFAVFHECREPYGNHKTV